MKTASDTERRWITRRILATSISSSRFLGVATTWGVLEAEPFQFLKVVSVILSHSPFMRPCSLERLVRWFTASDLEGGLLELQPFLAS